MSEYKHDIICNQQGLTLIEVLASLVLLSLLTMSILAVFTPAARWISKARQQTTASNYASAVLDDLRAGRLDYIDNSKEGMLAEELLHGHGYPWAQMEARITTMEQQNVLDNLYNVTVTVYASGDTRFPILQLSTIIKKE